MWYSSSSGRIELQLTAEQVKSVCHSGSNDAAVLELSKHPGIMSQINSIKPDTIASELKEFGCWGDVELADHAQNIQRLLWVACWNIFDNPGEAS